MAKIMNKTQYLKELNGYLYTLPEEERDAALKYYEEFFADAGEENEQLVISDLGSPKSLAQAIIDAQGELASPYRKWTTSEAPQYQPKARMSGGMKAWFIILIIFSCPIWISLGAAFFAVFVGLVAAVFGVWVGLVAAVLALIVSGIFVFIVGVTTAFVSPIAGVWAVGGGLVVLSIGLLLLIPLVLFTLKGIPCMFRGCINCISHIFHRRERKAAASTNN